MRILSALILGCLILPGLAWGDDPPRMPASVQAQFQSAFTNLGEAMAWGEQCADANIRAALTKTKVMYLRMIEKLEVRTLTLSADLWMLTGDLRPNGQRLGDVACIDALGEAYDAAAADMQAAMTATIEILEAAQADE